MTTKTDTLLQAHENTHSFEVINRQFAHLLDEDVANKLKTFHLLHSLADGGCLLRYTDQGVRSRDPAIMPYAPFTRSRIYTASRQAGSWNTDSQLTLFKGRYFYGFANGRVDEDDAGQRVRVSSSDDAVHWSDPVVVAGGEEGTNICHKCAGICATDDTLYVLDRALGTTPDPAVPGERRFDSMQVHVSASTDGIQWKRVFSFDDQISSIYEAPRLTAEGRLMCAGAIRYSTKEEAARSITGAPGHDTLTRGGAAILLWPGADICVQPEIVPIPQPHGSVFPGAEASWYQTDDRTIVVLWRDDGGSCRLWVNTSTDGGKSFCEPMITDIPDAVSRLYAGRLADGRHYLCSNAFATLGDRTHLMLLIGDDDYRFNKAYILVDDPTAMRLVGLLKINGYFYPCCLPVGDQLLVAYCVNKEDIECGVVDLTAC